MVDLAAGWSAFKKAAVDVEISALKAFIGKDVVVVTDPSELVKPGCRDGLFSVPTVTKEPHQR